ncbi:aminoacyl-tRNA deacylase and HDOD domain-containing protein [Pseudomonas aeruginosa]|nr:HDOD domain-containing protein [Pseudomonas aeruginosa]ELM3764316.1 HDOD domain-containing protein [Pseudomonas aeruginosa]
MTEAALASADAPHAPQVILQLLAKLGIACREVSDSAELPAARRVQAVLLDDAVGTLLVLFPQSQLLDLARLTELTGRKLLAIKPERLERMLGKHELHRLPALPPLTSSPCLYDERLLQEPRLLIESGQPGILLEIASNDFRGLLGKASAARFGEPLENINLNLDRPDDDRAEISQAVQAFTARRIQQRLEQTIEIPPLPQTAQKIIKLRVDPNASVDDITGLVETDPALAAQVVSWAASPYYAAPGKIRSVEDAIVRVLGFDLVINLALGHAYIEQHLLGITREQIGAWLMRVWDMPDDLYCALRFQQDPSYTGPNAVYANLICLTNRLLRNSGIGDGPQQAIPAALYERLGITPEKAGDAVKKVLEAEAALRELAAQFNRLPG